MKGKTWWAVDVRMRDSKPANVEGRELKDAGYLDCHGKLFVFLKRRHAEPSNNESERALRPSVIFRKDQRHPLRA